MSRIYGKMQVTMPKTQEGDLKLKKQNKISASHLTPSEEAVLLILFKQ